MLEDQEQLPTGRTVHQQGKLLQMSLTLLHWKYLTVT